jgi:3'-phosphoadenosine 5'-phosphosulfate sulfotransferase (PAPS reductase)/FAD synthetase
MKRIINFSGGKTSALMTIQNYRPGDIVLFTDTQREHPKTYKFINDFEANENIPVVRISHEGGFDGYLQKYNYRYIPNRVKRTCTVHLKIRTAKRWVRENYGKQDYEWLVGFRADEERRVKGYNPGVKYIHPLFPLYDQGVTKEMVEQYWLSKPYNLEIPSILGNCTLCFLKGQNAIISILRQFPELAEPWIADENKAKEIHGKKAHTYFDNNTYDNLLRLSKEHDLFTPKPIEELSPAFNCSCTN